MNWFYSKNGYYCIKSGFYIDHYFKLFFHKVYKEIVYYTGIIFMDKFVVNKLINNFFLSIQKLGEKLTNLKNKNNLNNLKLLILVFIIIIIVLILLIF